MSTFTFVTLHDTDVQHNHAQPGDRNPLQPRLRSAWFHPPNLPAPCHLPLARLRALSRQPQSVRFLLPCLTVSSLSTVVFSASNYSVHVSMVSACLYPVSVLMPFFSLYLRSICRIRTVVSASQSNRPVSAYASTQSNGPASSPLKEPRAQSSYVAAKQSSSGNSPLNHSTAR